MSNLNLLIFFRYTIDIRYTVWYDIKYPILAAKENTIYPLLRRLMKEEYVSSSWQESAEGLPPRKYYSITDKGLEYISTMSKEWNNLLNAINEIKGE